MCHLTEQKRSTSSRNSSEYTLIDNEIFQLTAYRKNGLLYFDGTERSETERNETKRSGIFEKTVF